jgi:hypothetical protein
MRSAVGSALFGAIFGFLWMLIVIPGFISALQEYAVPPLVPIPNFGQMSVLLFYVATWGSLLGSLGGFVYKENYPAFYFAYALMGVVFTILHWGVLADWGRASVFPISIFFAYFTLGVGVYLVFRMLGNLDSKLTR